MILKSAIENIDDDNLLKQNLKRKLYSVYDNRTLADTIVKGRLSGIVHNLVGAIAEKRQVVLQSLPFGTRSRRARPQGRAVRLHHQLRQHLVLRHGRRPLQALQNLAHRRRTAARRRMGARSGTPRRFHGRLPHERPRPAPHPPAAGDAGAQPARRGVSARRTRPRARRRATGCWRPKWRDSPASPVSSRDCSTTWRSSTRPS